MSKRKISWSKNSFLRIIGALFVALMLATSITPKITTAEQTTPYYQYFVVRKEWENDLASERPASVTINVIDSSDPQKEVIATGTMTATSDWKCDFTLPAYYENTTTKINYAVYEEPTNPKELDKYELSNPINNPLVIEKSLIIEDNSQRQIVTSYSVNHDGFDAAPTGSIFIDSKLDLDTAEMTMDSSVFKYYQNFTIYGDYEGYTNTQKRIVYTGNLAAGDNPLTGKTIVLKWNSGARDYFTGRRYKVRITISDIVIHTAAAVNNSDPNDPKYVAIVAYAGDLHMDAYYGPTFDEWPLNIVGVKANIQVEVLDADDQPVDGFTEIYVSDLDQPDYFDMFNTDGNKDNWASYFGVNRNWIESVKLKGGVASDIYLNSSSVIDYPETTKDKFASGSFHESEAYTSLKFLVKTDGSFEYEWVGSNCGTVLVSSGTVPPVNTFTNYIENTSSFYQVRYFFQKDDGSYSTTPDVTDSVTMIKPGSKVSVQVNAKTVPTQVDETKTDYVIDTSTGRTNLTEEKTVTISNDEEHPQILNVYFKQSCVVVYHDNYNDRLWDPADQTTPKSGSGEVLSLNDQTPAFDDGEGGITPVNPGYKFLGWSEIDIDEWTAHGTDEGPIFTPPTVQPENVSKKRTDYLAHWEALPNKYVVHYFYEVDGTYPSQDHPDYVSEIRTDKKTDELATITEEDKIPNSEKPNYYLNSGMTSEWSKNVDGDGNTILRVYFKKRAETIKIPVTGIE